MLLGLTSNLKELIQGLGRIDRIDSEFWEQVKHEVRDSFAYEDLPKGYIALQAILEKLEHDHQASAEIHEKMIRVIEEADEVSRDHEPAIGRRISAVFFSDGAGEC